MKTAPNLQDREQPELERLLKRQSRGLLSSRRLWFAVAALIVVVVAARVLRPSGPPRGPRFKTEAAMMGKLVVKISATGNLQPTNKVDVGSELSGILTHVMVDENDRVKKGQVLAQLDLSKLKDAVAKSRAALAAAEAQVLQAQATVSEARAVLTRYKQVAELSGGKVPSQSELDTAGANLKRAEANEAAAHASVTQTRANLQSDETNLSKATIHSPINGVVLTRKVEPGQTVAAALQAPVMFTIAEDLAKMELQVDVDEADVGQVKVGQHATFGVDSWPGRKYDGVITRVGYGSQTKDGVVSYPAVIEVANDDLSLRPGMTGTAEIVTATRENAVMVPNAALRFVPPATDAERKGPPGGIMGKLLPRPPASPPKAQAAPSDGAPRVWVLHDGQLAPVEVQTGVSNGQMTEVIGGAIQVGTEVVTETAGTQP